MVRKKEIGKSLEKIDILKNNFLLIFLFFITCTLSYSQILKSKPFLIPNSINAPLAKEASEITPHSFVANWDVVLNASGYYLDIYEITKINIEKDSTCIFINENFSKFTAGSINEPDNTNIGVGEVDVNLTETAGWFANDIYQAGENLHMPTLAKVFTPMVNLSTGSKKFCLSISFSSVSEDAVFLIAHTPDGNGLFWENNIIDDFFS